MSSHLHNCIVYIDAIKKGENTMKTKEELNAIKEEAETLNKKLKELTDNELNEVYGGYYPGVTEGGNDESPSGWINIDGVWYYLREGWGGSLSE